MKGVLEFNLPEEQKEFNLAQNGGYYKAVLDDLDNLLRNVIKYDASLINKDKPASKNEKLIAQYLREFLRDSLDNE